MFCDLPSGLKLMNEVSPLWGGFVAPIQLAGLLLWPLKIMYCRYPGTGFQPSVAGVLPAMAVKHHVDAHTLH